MLLSPSFPPVFVGVVPPRGEPLGDHDDQKGAAVAAAAFGLPLPFLETDGVGAKDKGGDEAEEGAAVEEEEEETLELVIAAAGAKAAAGLATAAAAFRTQVRRKKSTATAAARTPNPTPIHAPIDREGWLLAEAVRLLLFCFCRERERGKRQGEAKERKSAPERGKKTIFLTEALPSGAPARAPEDSSRRRSGQRLGGDDGDGGSGEPQGGELGLF